MSVDYNANYGIGYEVEAIEEIKEGLTEYLENELSLDFECFEVGSAWTGTIEGVYVTIVEPFKNGLNLTEAKELLDKELSRLKLKSCGEFNEVGGLYVY